ncbi:hypothetical protein VTJ04DRAFT_9615 [Mycothermus thermophilus]|uniref:uncharacterized protein n=1 Tax=Humicola insolens TaxID=85995 RepID=UPI003743A172
MHALETLQSGGYRHAGLTRLKLTDPLASFPPEILELGDTLEDLDLSGTGLSQLPSTISTSLPKLQRIILDQCNFTIFPEVLGSCPALETVSLRSNNMTTIPEDSLPPTLRCLILTNNRLTSLPRSISRCQHLRTCILTANELRTLPRDLGRCKHLTELRLSCNRLRTLPRWLFSSLPELAYLSFGSNPCVAPTANGFHKPKGLTGVPWSELEAQEQQASGSSHSFKGLWHQSPDYAEDVAVTLFLGGRGARDEGSAADELAAYVAAGVHEGLVTVLGLVEGHPWEEADHDGSLVYQGGVVTQVVPESYVRLGEGTGSSLPAVATLTASQERTTAALSSSSETQQHSVAPSTESQSQSPDPTAAAAAAAAATTTTAAGGTNANPFRPAYSPQTVLQLLTPLASALEHLHARGISHGAITPQNVLASAEDGHALLEGFGAATMYGQGDLTPDEEQSDACEEDDATNYEDDDGTNEEDTDTNQLSVGELVERVEVFAFGRLMENLLGERPTDAPTRSREEEEEEEEDRAEAGGKDVAWGLWQLRDRCVAPRAADRVGFMEVVEALEDMMGWRGMMRIAPRFG